MVVPGASSSRNARSYAKRLCLCASRPDVLIQAGVGAGHEAHVFAKRWGCRIVGFDPHPNVDASEYPGELVRTGLYSHNGFATFWKKSRWDRSSFKKQRRGEPIQVPVMTLEHAVESMQLKGKLLLWLDCEGAEYAILSTSPAVIKQCDWIYVENTHADLQTFLESKNFELHYKNSIDEIYRRDSVHEQLV